MLGDLFGEYIALMAAVAISITVVHVFVFAFTFNLGIRPLLAAVYVRDFRPNASSRFVKFRRIAGGLHILAILTPVIMLCIILAIAFSASDQTGVASLILASSSPVVYLAVYLTSGIWRYSATRRATSHHLAWSELLGGNYFSVLRELRVADARHVSSVFYVLFVAGVPLIWALCKLVNLQHFVWRTFLFIVALEFIAYLIMHVGYVAFLVLDKSLPHRRVINRSLDFMVLLEGPVESNISPSDQTFQARSGIFSSASKPFSSARWRTATHKSGFELAAALEKASLGMRGRFTKDSHDLIYSEFSKVSDALRRESIEANSPENRDRYANLARCALALVATENPERLIPRVRELTTAEVGATPPSGRFLIFLGSINEHVQQTWGTIKIIGAAIAVTVVIAFGKWDQIGKYFLQ